MTLRGLRRRISVKMNEQAVSEAIGFVLILGIVISGIGLVTLYGYPVLLKEQTNTDVKNMERAMIVIQNDMKSLCYKNVPYKETSLQVSGGTLEVIDAGDSTRNVTITSTSGYDSGLLELGELHYRSDRGTESIILENGAVVMRQEDATGSAMLAEPRWFCDVDTTTDPPTKTFVIYLMEIDADEPMAKSGMATVKMKLLDALSDPPIPNPGTVKVTYNDTSEECSTAWKNYLTSTVGMSVSADPSDPEGTYTLPDVDKLVIKRYSIQILGI